MNGFWLFTSREWTAGGSFSLAATAQSSGYDQRRAINFFRESSCNPMVVPEANWVLGKIHFLAEDDENALPR